MRGFSNKNIGSYAPPLSLGLACLIWGFGIGLPIIGIAIAIALELPSISKLNLKRWEFNDKTQWRVWTLCIALTIFTFVISLLGDSKLQASYFMLQWSPLCLLPIALLQRFGTDYGISFKTLAFFNVGKGGANENPILEYYLNMDLPFLFLLLCSASSTSPGGYWYYISCVALFCWVILKNPHQQKWQRSLPILIIIPILGFFVFLGLRQTQIALEDSIMELVGGSNFKDPNKSKTHMGSVGKKQNSTSIIWKITMQKGPAPQYLYSATYNYYINKNWLNHEHRKFSNIIADSTGLHFKLNNSPAKSIATFQGKRGGNPSFLSLPSGVTFIDLPDGGILKQNPFHSTKLAELESSVADFKIGFNQQKNIMPNPDESDLDINKEQLKSIDAFILKSKLSKKYSAKKNLSILKKYFTKNFQYSSWQKSPSDTPVKDFLLSSHTGHCEYFATSTALILRRLNIPTRYVTGFKVSEIDGNTCIVRGINAHAWNNVYYNNQWYLIDFTPAISLSAELEKISVFQPIIDFFSNVSFMLHRWGRNEYIRKNIILGLWFIIPITILATIWQIYKKGGVKQSALVSKLENKNNTTSPFISEIKKLEKIIPQREKNETLLIWVRKHKHLIETKTYKSIIYSIKKHNQYRFEI